MPLIDLHNLERTDTQQTMRIDYISSVSLCITVGSEP